jgi:phospholipid/cholesterol/gamma-HCH transport system ATP-binding protein
MIQLKNISKKFGDKAVLNDLSLEFPPGEKVFVLGRSGTGKSVLLKHIVGLLEPDAGQVWVDGHEVTALSEDELVSIRRSCGMVFQYPALLDSLTLFENIALGLPQFPEDSEELKNGIIEKLEWVGLTASVLEKYPTELSHTVQKRAAIARTLALDPKHLLFDEPTTGMDPIVTRLLNQATVIVVSHDLKSAFEVADRIILLDQGRAVFDGKTAEFRESSHPLAQAFLEESKWE